MEILTLSNSGSWVIAEAFLLTPQISAVWQADGSATKEKALKDLKYIYFVGYPLSPYRRRYSEDEVEKVVRHEALEDPKYKPSKIVLNALAWYKDYCTNVKEFAMFSMFEKMLEGFMQRGSKINWETIEPTDVDKWLKIVNNLGDVMNNFRKHREAYYATLIGNTVTRKGGVTKYALPKSERK